MHWSPYWPTPASRASPSSPGAYSRVRTAARRPGVPGGDLSWAGVVSTSVAHGGFAAVTRRLEAVAPTHDTAALDHAFRAAVVTPGAGAAFAAPLRDAVIASSSAAAALAGSGLAVWLCARVDADAARGAAAAPVTWEECVAALVACPFPVSVGGTPSLSPRAAVQRVANLAHAHKLVVRSSTRAPRRARCGCTCAPLRTSCEQKCGPALGSR